MFRRPRIPVRIKVLVPMVSIIVALVAATLWVINVRIAAQVRGFAADTLLTAQVVLETFRNLRAQDLVDPRRAFQNEPRFKAIMKIADPPTMRVLLHDVIQERAVDFIVVGDSQGKAVVEEVRPPGLRLVDASGHTELDLAAARDGHSVTTVLCHAGKLLDVAIVPVIIDEQVAGTVATGFVLGDSAAADLRQLTGCEVVLCAGDAIAGLTLTQPAERQEFAEMLRSTHSVLRLKNQGGGADSRVQDLVLNGEHYIALAGFLGPWGQADRPAYVLLAHYEPQLSLLQESRRLLVTLGLSGILLSLLAAWGIVNRATAPLHALRESAEAVGRGDFNRRVNIRANDELGDLANAFNAMTDNLRVSRENLESTVATLRETRAQLLQSEKLSAIGEFIAGVAHELNNPLTILVGFSDILRESQLTPEQHQNVRLIADAADRCHKVVQNLLSFARQRPPERVPVNVNELLETTLRFLAYELKTGDVAVFREFDAQLPAVCGDPHQLQQVFLNIINNARQAMEQHRVRGQLQLKTTMQDERVRITIADNGPGISPANFGKIFDPFFTTKAAGKGTGLGLSVSYGIIQEHGGALRVDSAEGRGATFTIELPLATPANTLADQGAPSADERWKSDRPLRGLVVDDEDGLLELVRQMLGETGIAVDVCRDGLSAVTAVGRQTYDVIVCDWRMPGLGGREFLSFLQEHQPVQARRLIFMTGDVLNPDMQAFVQQAGCPCLLKPFTAHDLLAAVQSVTAHQNLS